MNESSYRERIIRLEYDSTPLKEHKNLGGRDEPVFAAGHVQGIMQAAEIAKEADARIKELEGQLAEMSSTADAGVTAMKHLARILNESEGLLLGDSLRALLRKKFRLAEFSR